MKKNLNDSSDFKFLISNMASRNIPFVIFVVVFCGAMFAVEGIGGERYVRLIISIISMGSFATLITIIVRNSLRYKKEQDFPMTRVNATVVGKCVEPKRKYQSIQGMTAPRVLHIVEYYITFGLIDGTQRIFCVPENEFRRLEVGAVGTLICQQDIYKGFDKLRDNWNK